MYSIMCFNLRKAAAGFDHADDKKQHQQGKTDGLQRSVYIYDDVPDAAAFKFCGRLSYE